LELDWKEIIPNYNQQYSLMFVVYLVAYRDKQFSVFSQEVMSDISLPVIYLVDNDEERSN
jgi:hypothetical protein